MGLPEKPSGEQKRHLLWSFQAGFSISNCERQLLLSAYSFVRYGDTRRRPHSAATARVCVVGTAPFHPWPKKLGLKEVRSFV